MVESEYGIPLSLIDEVQAPGTDWTTQQENLNVNLSQLDPDLAALGALAGAVHPEVADQIADLLSPSSVDGKVSTINAYELVDLGGGKTDITTNDTTVIKLTSTTHSGHVLTQVVVDQVTGGRYGQEGRVTAQGYVSYDGQQFTATEVNAKSDAGEITLRFDETGESVGVQEVAVALQVRDLPSVLSGDMQQMGKEVIRRTLGWDPEQEVLDTAKTMQNMITAANEGRVVQPQQVLVHRRRIINSNGAAIGRA